MPALFVTTMYRSDTCLSEFHRRASEAARSSSLDVEFIYVNDGSPDTSVLALQSQDPRISIVDASRNFGHHPAMLAGPAQAPGDEVFLGLVVTGISQDCATSLLESALKKEYLPVDPIQVISPDDSTQGAASRLGTIDAGLMTGGRQGTGVPGVTSGVPTAGGYGTRYFRNETLSDRLDDLEIPDGVDDYIETLQAGRSVVAHFAKAENLNQVTQIFRSSGLAKVETF